MNKIDENEKYDEENERKRRKRKKKSVVGKENEQWFI